MTGRRPVRCIMARRKAAPAAVVEGGERHPFAFTIGSYPDFPIYAPHDGAPRLIGHCVDWRTLSVTDMLIVFGIGEEVVKVAEAAGASASATEVGEAVDAALKRGLALFFRPNTEGEGLNQAQRRDVLLRWLETVGRSNPIQPAASREPSAGGLT